MNAPVRVTLLMIAVTLLAGMGGGWLGVRYGLAHARTPQGLDAFVHQRLQLSPAQAQRLEGIEAQFAADRKAPEQQMRAANHELAAALTAEHGYGPAAAQAIAHFHGAMQSLQEATIQHVFAMRSVLTPAQAQQFDRAIAEALNSDPP